MADFAMSFRSCPEGSSGAVSPSLLCWLWVVLFFGGFELNSSSRSQPVVSSNGHTDAEPSAAVRPRRYDDAVCRLAAEELAPDIAEWMEEASLSPDQVVDLAKALRSQPDNAFRLARELERRWYIEPDAALVEILDNNGLWEAERQLVRAWVSETGALADLPDGTVVIWRDQTGEITGRNEDEATYTVWNERMGRPKQPRCGFVWPAEQCAVDPASPPVSDRPEGSAQGNSGRPSEQ
jgi:hypothetical protein